MNALYTIIILIIPFFGFGQIPDNISNNGLVGWWSFNGNANDESTNSNDGIVYGATLTTDRFGNENSAYEFNVESSGGWGSAQNRIVVENPSIPDVNAFTMSAWVLINEKPSPFNNRPHTIMGRWDGNGTSVFRNQMSYSGEYCSNVVVDDVELLHTSPNPINYNEWNHVVMTFDGISLKKYINGEFDSETSSSGQISYSDTDLTFGELHMGNGHWYLLSGKLDDLSYWSRALTETEITELYNISNGLFTYVPDDNFEQALIDFGYDDVLDDYVLTENISGLTYIDLCTKDIADLTGIEDFVSLTNLCCGINQLTTLDLSSNTQLETLYASDNQLTSIDLSNNVNLTSINCGVNQLIDIDLSNNPNLSYLNCGGNLLTNLDVSNNTNLVEIQCSNNSILSLDLSNNVNLTSINCGFNDIASLDFSNNPDLTYINCRANELTFLNVTNNTLLNELSFGQNQLLNIDVTNNLLLELLYGYYNNDLQTIDVSNNDSLKVLLLHACDLTSIDLSNNLLLTEVNLNGNQLTNLDLSNNSNLIELVVSVNYNLTFLDLRNGNNINMSIDATASTLTCINVDDTEWATENWTNDNGSVDAQVSFSEDCQNITYVPDDNFEQALIDFGYDDVLDDYVLTENISDITFLNVSTKGISDLTGIEDFESLEILYCYDNNLSSLDISSNSNLIKLYCYNNQITNIDISQNQNLESFDIGNNNLSSIDVSNNATLKLIHCFNNQLSTLDVSNNTLLNSLHCWGNQISNLDISQNLELTSLQCYDNLLSTLDISLNTELEELYCSSNQLSSLNINNNIDLVRLRCGINQLSSLDVSNNLDLKIIYCSNNSITELEVSTNSLLSEFYCSVNELTKLDVSNNTNLTILNCSNNDLDSLNLKNGSNTQMVLTATSNPDLFCITVDDTDWSSANWTTGNQSINNWNSFSEDCELGFITFGCTDSNSCSFQPTANTDDGSCIYIESNDTIISCDSYFWNDLMYYQSGDYSDTLTSVEGCDSIINLNLIILQSDNIFNDTTVCDEFIWAEDTIISSGNYFFAYTNSNGCDSIHYFDVTVNPSSEAVDEKFTCEDSFLWFDNNTYFEDNFTAQYIIANEYNCPLTITLNLTFLENPTSQTVVEECESYTWNGSTYNTSGQYTYTTTADNGCDSTATLDLTINDSQFSTDVQFDCNEFTWTDGITYTESNNSATVTLTANNGCDSIVTLNLTIYESDTTFSSITACDEFIWNNISYTQSGFYTNTFENTNGCDSTHTYDLTILESTFGADTQVQCDEYTWIDGNTYTQSTNSPTFTLTNSLGCDSTVTLNLTINLSDTSFTDITACESFEWNGVTYTESGSYNDVISCSNPSIGETFEGGIVFHIDSVLNIGYIATDDTIATSNFGWVDMDCWQINIDGAQGIQVGTGNQNTIDIMNSECGNISAAQFAYEYDNGFNDWFLPSIDELYLIYQNLFTTGIVNYYSLESNNWYWSSTEGVDSTFNNKASSLQFIDGEIFYNNNKSSHIGGIIGVRTFQLACDVNSACDSVAVLNLTITQPDTSFTEITACDEFIWNGQTYTESGSYTQSISSNNEYSMSFDGNDDYINCQNNLAGTYSSFTVEGWINISSFPSIDEGKIIDIGGPDSRIVLQTLPNQGLNLHIDANNVNVDGMASAYNLLTNQWVHVAGVWDSLSYVKVYINGIEANSNTVSPTISSLNITSQSNIIIGARYNIQSYFHGLIDKLSVWSKALSAEEIQNYMNCSPIGNEVGLVGYWNFEEGQGDTVFDLSGNGNDGIINGATYSTDVPEQSCQLTTTNGCDSVSVLNLTITQPDTSYTTITACDNYEWNGVTLTESGTYFYPESQNLQTIDGFSYMGQLDNSLYYISENLTNWNDASAACIDAGGHLVSINSEEENNFIGTNLTNNSIWIGLYQASDNSPWQLTDGSDPTYFNWRSDQPGGSNQNCVDFYYDASLSGSVFENQYNVWTDANCNDNYYYILEIPSNELTTINGCDSVAVIELTILESTFGIDTQVHCDEYTWIDGNTYTQSTNSPTFTLTNSIGCDSIVILDLSILESTSSFTSASACESYLWNDSLYTESGLKVFNTTNSVGCDSIARLFLTINEPTFATDTQVHCDEYTWIDGISYTENNDSATHTIIGGNSNGCDSIVTLNLTIFNSVNTFGDTTVCDEFVWNGINYTVSGIFSNTFVNSNGCDSTHTIDITILESTFGVDTQIHCDEYTWIDGNTYTESTNSPSFTLTNSLGCDSIVILNLSILEST
ncbi:hypothetical protein N9V65_04125, partial [Flavobacteriales bacterium]|nr:hypothetical protein [Flavobacteriales bacterium]